MTRSGRAAALIVILSLLASPTVAQAGAPTPTSRISTGPPTWIGSSSPSQSSAPVDPVSSLPRTGFGVLPEALTGVVLLLAGSAIRMRRA